MRPQLARTPSHCRSLTTTHVDRQQAQQDPTSPERFLAQIEQATELNHITVFLTGQGSRDLEHSTTRVPKTDFPLCATLQRRSLLATARPFTWKFRKFLPFARVHGSPFVLASDSFAAWPLSYRGKGFQLIGGSVS